MGISFYSPPNIPVDEQERHRAVLSSNLMDARFAREIGSIVRSAAAVADTGMAAATLILDDRQMVIAGFRIDDVVSRRSTSICGHTILNAPQAMCVPDTTRDARFAENPVLREGAGIRFYFGAPLLSPSGHPLGALCVLDKAPRAGVTRNIATAIQEMAARIVALPRLAATRQQAAATIV